MQRHVRKDDEILDHKSQFEHARDTCSSEWCNSSKLGDRTVWNCKDAFLSSAIHPIDSFLRHDLESRAARKRHFDASHMNYVDQRTRNQRIEREIMMDMADQEFNAATSAFRLQIDGMPISHVNDELYRVSRSRFNGVAHEKRILLPLGDMESSKLAIDSWYRKIVNARTFALRRKREVSRIFVNNDKSSIRQDSSESSSSSFGNMTLSANHQHLLRSIAAPQRASNEISHHPIVDALPTSMKTAHVFNLLDAASTSKHDDNGRVPWLKLLPNDNVRFGR